MRTFKLVSLVTLMTLPSLPSVGPALAAPPAEPGKRSRDLTLVGSERPSSPSPSDTTAVVDEPTRKLAAARASSARARSTALGSSSGGRGPGSARAESTGSPGRRRCGRHAIDGRGRGLFRRVLHERRDGLQRTL